MTVIVVGVMQGTIFYVQSIAHPPPERRQITLNLLREVEYLGVIPGSDVSEMIYVIYMIYIQLLL